MSQSAGRLADRRLTRAPPSGDDSNAGVAAYHFAMTAEKSEAIVIRQTDFSETSRVVTFFTRESGKLGMMAKGGRRRRNPYDDALDLLSQSEVVFLRKSSGRLHILTEATLRSRFRPPADTIQPLYAGYYIAELLDALTEEADPHPELYDAAVTALGRLASGPSRPLNVVARFETQLLRHIGHLPSFSECLKCGQHLDPEREYVHWVGQGGVLCDGCRSEGFRQRQIRTGTLRLLQYLADAPDGDLPKLKVTGDQVSEARMILDAAITHLMERQPKMRRYLSAK